MAPWGSDVLTPLVLEGGLMSSLPAIYDRLNPSQGSSMPKLVVRSFTISLDGFSAAPGQSQEAPFGKDGLRLMDWFFATKTFRNMVGQAGGDEEGVDNDFAAHAGDNIGASIMGRHMFGPPPDAQDQAAWKGWWGEDPPYHHPVFVLT